MKINDFVEFCRIWHLGGFGCMENTPTGPADDLPSIPGFFKNDPKSRSVNIFSAAGFGIIIHNAGIIIHTFEIKANLI